MSIMTPEALKTLRAVANAANAPILIEPQDMRDLLGLIDHHQATSADEIKRAVWQQAIAVAVAMEAGLPSTCLQNDPTQRISVALTHAGQAAGVIAVAVATKHAA
jgi:hypothetical protein